MNHQPSSTGVFAVMILISTVKSHIFVYNLCEYSVPIWRDEVIGTTVIEVVDVSGDSFIEEDVPLVGLARVAALEPDGSFSFEDALSLEDTSYRFGEDGRMEARFACLPEYFEYYEIDISDGFEVPMTIQPDRTGSHPVSCLNATCFGASSLGTPITSQTATTDIDTNFAIFLCPPKSTQESLSDGRFIVKSSKKGDDEKNEDKKEDKSKAEGEVDKIDVKRSTMDNPDSVTQEQEAPPNDGSK
ncbi:hypothetical protein PRIPAC_90494 [Pristionchus pacificus]|uniref:Uncharacterized protein n=1 Tax=Pristionchus pacificus TaxID=54126 RepID=A0A2A6CXD0_PRIPA|nr:hypothetical protein PRIPAC_90494 [Pristionchus pacificus]|eukprot:PDM82835.1 hypothetical protein PRIPAC_37228 [Pristionchus pacificus]